MANRDNHYEAAFEEYLRARGVPYVAVDEARRSLLSNGGSIKSLDFIVSAPGQIAWLVDVKGRAFPRATKTSNIGKTGPRPTTCAALPAGSSFSGRIFAACSCSLTTCSATAPRCPRRSSSSIAANRTDSWPCRFRHI